MVERLENGLYPLPPIDAKELARRAPRPVGRTIAITGAASNVGQALARSYAAPGVRLCLFGGSAAGLAPAAADCRVRGALVETVLVDPGDGDGLAAQVEAFDRRTPIDLLLAAAEGAADTVWGARRVIDSGFLGIAAVVETLAARMRRRGRGQIAIVDAFAPDSAARQACRAGLIACGRTLGRQFAADKIAVSVAAPGALAARILDANGRLPEAERLAAAIRRGVERRRRRIGFPPPLTTALYALALLPPLVADWFRASLPAPLEPLDETDEPAVLSGESAPSD
jgi:NAD(P)-dependent dehydrogenase (short-subunit alcohol dehydrogenase family)